MKTAAVFICVCLLPALFSCHNGRDNNGDRNGNPTDQSINGNDEKYPERDSYSEDGNMQQNGSSGNSSYENGTGSGNNMSDTSGMSTRP